MSESPPATIGALIRAARQRIVPELTIEAAARRAGMSGDYWGAIERDKVTDRRGGKATRVRDQTIVRMLAVIPLDQDHLEILERLRPEAAALLARQGTPAPRPVTLVPAMPQFGEDDDDAAIEAWIAAAPEPHREVLGWIWAEIGPDGKPVPRGVRVTKMLGWMLYSAPRRRKGDG